MCIYLCIGVYLYVFVYVYMSVCVKMWLCVRVCVCVRVSVYVLMCLYACLSVCIDTGVKRGMLWVRARLMPKNDSWKCILTQDGRTVIYAQNRYPKAYALKLLPEDGCPGTVTSYWMSCEGSQRRMPTDRRPKTD